MSRPKALVCAKGHDNWKRGSDGHRRCYTCQIASGREKRAADRLARGLSATAPMRPTLTKSERLRQRRQHFNGLLSGTDQYARTREEVMSMRANG